LGTSKIRDVMSTDCVTVNLDDNIDEIAVKMKEHDIGIIPVVDGKKLLGVVTDRDLVIRGYAEKKSGSSVVKDVMTNNVQTITPDTSVDEAARLMSEAQIRRLAVVDDQGGLAGIVSIGDLAIRDHYEDEAGQALSGISQHTT